MKEYVIYYIGIEDGKEMKCVGSGYGKNENEAKDKAIKLLHNRGYNFIDIVKCKIFK